MGDLLAAPAGTTLQLTVHAKACEGSKIEFLLDGKPTDVLPDQIINANDQSLHAAWPSDGQHHWLETDVIDSDGHLQLLGNPIYLNWSSPTGN